MVEEKVIATNITVCRGFLRKSTGLMFRWPGGRFAFVFPFRRPRPLPITMWFVFYPIDIVFLDEEGYVVDMVKSLPPWGYYNPVCRASTFIEFPEGTLAKHRIRIGSRLAWSADEVRIRSP